MAKRIKVSEHAKKRCIERCRIEPEKVEGFINNRMKKASFMRHLQDGKLRYISDGLIIITDKHKESVCTIYPQPSTLFAPAVNRTLDRELQKMTQSINKSLRTLYSQIAEVNQEIANSYMKLATCRNPHSLAEKISELDRAHRTLSSEIRSKVREKEELHVSAKALRIV